MVTFFDVCRAMEDPILETNCLMGLPECGGEVPCSGHVLWAEAKAKIIATLKTLTFKQIAADEISSPDAQHDPRLHVRSAGGGST